MNWSLPTVAFLDFHADDGAGLANGVLASSSFFSGLSGDFDLLAAGLVENLAERRIAVEIEGEAVQDLVDRIVAVVVDGVDLAAAGVLESQALQEIVDVAGGEGKIDRASPFTSPSRWK